MNVDIAIPGDPLVCTLKQYERNWIVSGLMTCMSILHNHGLSCLQVITIGVYDVGVTGTLYCYIVEYPLGKYAIT